MAAEAHWTRLDRDLLVRWPLPAVASDADKEERGRVLVIAGSREIAGAAVLAGTAALRAGAGKLVIATAAGVATQIAVAVPEARVVALPETAAGGLSPAGSEQLAPLVRAAAAVVIGPGLMDEDATVELVLRLLPMASGKPVVLDALALKAIARAGRLAGNVIATPHAGEMAGLTGESKQQILRNPEAAARTAATRWNLVLALKGATTLIARPDAAGWRHECGEAGLATSGSGDVLAGLIGGLLARGAEPAQAAAWGVVLHALAGAALAQRLGPLGFLARELAGEIPALLRDL